MTPPARRRSGGPRNAAEAAKLFEGAVEGLAPTTPAPRPTPGDAGGPIAQKARRRLVRVWLRVDPERDALVKQLARQWRVPEADVLTALVDAGRGHLDEARAVVEAEWGS